MITLSSLLSSILIYEATHVNFENNQIYALDKLSSADFNFASVGDWGCTPNSKNTVKNIIDKEPELILGLGDYAYKKNANCWFQIIKPIDHKMKIVIGNHDHLFYIDNNTFYSSQPQLQQYTGHFNLTEQYYSFNHQKVHFLAMSTEVPFEIGSKQYNFVTKDLKKAASNPKINWIVVFYHRAAYTSPVFPGSASNTDVRDIYHPLFDKYGVDLVIQGHIHAYQRSYPIKYNATDSFNPIITDNNTENYIDPNGEIFTTVGTGGSTEIHYLQGPPRPYMAAHLNAFGFLNINVLNNGTTITGEFYDNNGTIRDHFKITKPEKEQLEESEQQQSQQNSSTLLSSQGPRLMAEYNNKFKVESVFQGVKLPTDMTFLGPKDILVLEKNSGTVHRIVNGQMLDKPLLDVNVANKNERGLLGVVASAASNASDATRYVWLYYTETEKEGSDKCPKANYCLPGNEPIGNRLYRYDLSNDGTKLVKPKLLLNLSATPGPGHNGGKMAFGPENDIFLVIGDLMGHKTRAQNFEEGKDPDGTGGVLRINEDGSASQKGVLGNKYPLNLYYAYGIRNSFGLAFDPVTGNLWDTENGPAFGDEINLVEPGFNSGWKDIQGIWNYDDGKIGKDQLDLAGLDDFDGKGKYSDPEFTWKNTVGPTALKFFNSDKMGVEYKDSLFVGDIHDGNLYHFALNGNRTSLILNGSLADKKADTPEELKEIIFASGFSGISDLEVGPDGYLYILSLGNGEIYRIVPR
jgi:glucose/arabinose dehydrogenase/predicted phosphodiesterase